MKAKKTIKYYQNKNNKLAEENAKLQKNSIALSNIITHIFSCESDSLHEYVGNLKKELLKD